jgi:transcriptional regulator with XRE-family HTH domain
VIKLHRLKAGLSQEELALLIGVKPSEISHLESGRRNPKLGTMRRVAKGLDVPSWQMVALAERLEAWIDLS